MRIFMASDLYYPYLMGGGEKRMYEIAKRLAKKHEVHLLTRRYRGLPSYEMNEGVHIHRITLPSGQIRLESPLDSSAFMIGLAAKGMRLGDFDICAPQQFFPIPPLWLIAETRRRPIIPTIHDVYGETWLQKFGTKGSLMSLFEKIMLKLPYTRVITVSNSTKKKLLDAGIPEDKIEVIPNGVSLEEFDRVKTRKSEKPRIVYVGRLVKYKHVDDLILAFSRLNLDAELYIVGDGPERQNLEFLVRKLGIENKVVFTGFTNEERKIELIKSSHVLVLPSTTEGFGIVLIEAMAAKTPPIATDIPPLRELLGDEEMGLLFQPRRVDELQNKLERLLKDTKLREKFCQRGYDMVKKNFCWDKIVKRVEDLFIEVTAGS
jgi:glycosyltransferase involved in cell wall biosynthesis